MKLIKNLPKGLILKTLIFQSKLKTFTKSKTRIPSALVFLVMKIKKHVQSVYQKNIVKKKKTCSFIINRKKKERDIMLLSKILVPSCMIIHYIVKENIFVAIVYKLLAQKKY